MKIGAWSLAAVLLLAAGAPLLAQDAAPSLPPGAVLIQGRVLRSTSDGLVVKCAPPVSVVLVRDYPQPDQLAPGADIEVAAYPDGTYTYTNHAGLDRTVVAYVLNPSGGEAVPEDGGSYFYGQAPAITYVIQGSKWYGGHDHRPGSGSSHPLHGTANHGPTQRPQHTARPSHGSPSHAGAAHPAAASHGGNGHKK